MKKSNDIELPEGTRIALRVPVNTPKLIQVDVVLNGKTYGSFSIIGGTTGEFDLGAIAISKKNKKKGLRWKFPLKLTSMNIKTGIVDLRFERKEG